MSKVIRSIEVDPNLTMKSLTENPKETHSSNAAVAGGPAKHGQQRNPTPFRPWSSPEVEVLENDSGILFGRHERLQ
jgi:hypothetical protein